MLCFVSVFFFCTVGHACHKVAVDNKARKLGFTNIESYSITQILSAISYTFLSLFLSLPPQRSNFVFI